MIPRGPFGSCPRSLAELNEFYFFVVRPLEETLARIVWGDHAALLYHEYMYVCMGKRVAGDQFSTLLRTTLARFCDVDDVTPLVYRQLPVRIARECLALEAELLEAEEDAQDIETPDPPSPRRLFYNVATTPSTA